ncbi:hypothetical protein BC749_12317 [Flavobacterium araucananum]|uniref:DNA primase n=1 Tax=Flavobacterium araucananum TaxID=946678 RepID=A0A227P5W3_9FLAO|nr:hypothetical protein [Flavobacterium araucananum]OXG05321.1 hypothetical protein B0A64_13185 [Flavobacterium araucananum]PWJ89359.1 hypothetical protein BC749_12317 [Flavobacterium araucananum]
MEKIRLQMQEIRPDVPLSIVELPEGHSLNDMWVNYGSEGISNLLKSAKTEKTGSALQIVNGYKISYTGIAGVFYVVGNLPMDLGNLRVSLQIVAHTTQKKHRLKVDLFDFGSVQSQCGELSEKQGFDFQELETDFLQLTDLLEQHREALFDAEINPVTDRYSEKELTPQAHEKAVEFLSKPNLLENINKLLEQNGIVGEEQNRMVLFVLASSYKMPYLMHAIVQGSSGEGKSHLINGIAQCMPQEDVMNMTRITSKSLYHYRDKELINKLIVIQDFDGLDEEAQYAFREMQSAKFLTSSTVVKDIFGNNRGRIKQVQAHFASMTTTTKAEVYYDNMSRSVILGVDESQAQTMRIIAIQNKKIAGKANNENEVQATQLLRNAMRVLKSYEVINPFADKLTLPLEAKMLRRLNSQFQNFVSQITILHQYQRKTDNKGRLIATKEDVKSAVDIFFTSIIIKVDELDKSTRQFFENLKGYVKSQQNGTTHRFTNREIRQKLNISKTSSFRYMQLLQELEYIQAIEGSVNRGFKYVISYWDNMEKLKSKIRKELNAQLEQF